MSCRKKRQVNMIRVVVECETIVIKQSAFVNVLGFVRGMVRRATMAATIASSFRGNKSFDGSGRF